MQRQYSFLRRQISKLVMFYTNILKSTMRTAILCLLTLPLDLSNTIHTADELFLSNILVSDFYVVLFLCSSDRSVCTMGMFYTWHPERDREASLIPTVITIMKYTRSLKLKRPVTMLMNISGLDTALPCLIFSSKPSQAGCHPGGERSWKESWVRSPTLSDLFESAKWSTLNSCAIQGARL